jgi:hypothetical protein
MRWMVRAKSGTSLDRETRRRIGMTLKGDVRDGTDSISREDVRYKTNNNPEETDGPADGIVAPNTVPVEN